MSLDVIVVGGGQAGLAMGHVLARQGRRFTILEAADRPAAAWHDRWESLRLFTPARYSALPGRPFPGDPDRHPMRDEVVDYLTDYARDLPVQLGMPVTRVSRDNGGYAVEAGGETLHADRVVVATGPFQVPRVPELALELDVPQRHSSAYRRPTDLPDGPTLVVGGGNTGCQIAEELAATREVHLAVGTHQTRLPQRLLGRDLFWYLDRLRLMGQPVTSPIGRRMRDRDPTLVGTSPAQVARDHGVVLHERAVGAEGAGVTFSDGAHVEPASVVWATGFGLDHSWVDVPAALDERGRLRHDGGVTPSRGLYVLGLPWLRSRGSALLGWVGRDAEHLGAAISRGA